MKTSLIITVLLLLAPVGFAGDSADHATRFHDAFLAEVVDGKVAESARTYYELLEDETVSAHLRRESRFRFAICCVLLGRADEGRARLAEILADFQASPVQKARAEEYLKSLEGVGIGSELDRRLQELTFQLGRIGPTNSTIPGAYSDIRVIGKPAVRFLKRLLAHDDENLRHHAFVLLCSLGEPGMAEVWEPGIVGRKQSYFREYMNKHPLERERIEERLVKLEDDVLPDSLPDFRGVVSFSDPFLTKLAGREGLEAWTLELTAWDKSDRLPLLRNWLVSGREPISTGAASVITNLMAGVGSTVPSQPGRVADQFPLIVDRLFGKELPWRSWGSGPRRNLRSSRAPRISAPNRYGLRRIAVEVPAGDLLTTLEKLVAAGEKWEGEPWTNPLFTGLADAVADGIDAKLPEEVDLPAYAVLVTRWLTCYGKLDLARLARINKKPDFPDDAFLKHLSHLFGAMEQDAAERFARQVYAGPVGIDSDFAKALYSEDLHNVGLVLAAAERAHPKVRTLIIGSLPFFLSQQGRGTRDPALAKEQAAVLPLLLPDLDQHQNQVVHNFGWWLASALPTEEALEFIVAMAVAGDDAKMMTYGLLAVHQANRDDRLTAYRVRVAVPALDLLWEKAPGAYRRHLLDAALEFLSQHYMGFHPLGEARETVEEFILDHAGDISESRLMAFAPSLKDLPLERWIPRLPPTYWVSVGKMIPAERCTELADALTRDPSKANDSVISFIRNSRLEYEKKREYLSRLLLSGEPGMAGLVLTRVAHGNEVGADHLESLLDDMLAKEMPDLDLLLQLSRLLVVARPSEKLIPAAQELLASKHNYHRETGIDLAMELGSYDLVPYLEKLLDSVDSSLRTRAKEAIDSLEEQKRSAAGSDPFVADLRRMDVPGVELRAKAK